MLDNKTINVLIEAVGGLIGVALLIAVVAVISSISRVYLSATAPLDPASARASTNPDPAWPNYLYKQRALDIVSLWNAVMGVVKGSFKRFGSLAILWPVFALAGVFALVLWIVFATTGIVVSAIGGVLYWIAVGVVRGADGLYSRLRRSEASCPVCYEVMDRPAYNCPSCGNLHRDIRPGKNGSILRVCACGHRLPTGVLRAAWQLQAVCQHCGVEVHRGAAVLQDVRVPIFGEPHAGKTRLIFAGFHDISQEAKHHGLEVMFPDPTSKERAEAGFDQIARGERTIKTVSQLAPALTCQIGAGTKGALLHAFDAAGERFRGGEAHDELRYLGDGHTLFFVVDPFAVPGVRRVLASQPRSGLLDEHLQTQARNPEDVYGEVVSRVRNSGTRTKKQRLAIVVGKADILAQLGVAPPSDSIEIRGWLYENGLHNVVLAASREFKEVRYFAVASIDRKQTSSDYAAVRPFLWALATRGFSALGAAGLKPVSALTS